MLGSKRSFFAGGKHKVTENDFYCNCGMGNCVERAVHWKRVYHCDNDYALGNIVDVGRGVMRVVGGMVSGSVAIVMSRVVPCVKVPILRFDSVCAAVIILSI